MVTKNNNELTINYPDGTNEKIPFDDTRYDRYFNVIGSMLGFITKEDNGNMLTLAPYVLLHNHGEYSLLDGMSTAKKVAEKLSNTDAVYTPYYALTDHGMMSGSPSFYAALSKKGKRAITGCELSAKCSWIQPPLNSSREG
jgi:DNA polymerase III alpha subunit (gram-positive type)